MKKLFIKIADYFGYVLLDKQEYIIENKKLADELYEKSVEIDGLNDTIKEQKEIIESLKDLIVENQDNSECKVGAWCSDCKHKCIIPTQFKRVKIGNTNRIYYQYADNDIYCKKHLHEICKEWEKA